MAHRETTVNEVFPSRQMQMTFHFGLRRWLANRTFRTAYPVMLTHPACSAALFAAVTAQPGERILLIRHAHSPSVVPYAGLHPETRFVSLEPDEASALAAGREIQALGVSNIEPSRLREPPLLPFANASFDKVVSLMNLHTAMPEQRLAMVREMLRVLRRKGMVYAADIDAATTAAERNFLKIAHFALGDERMRPHVDGTWPDILAAAGFLRLKRITSQSSVSLRIGVVRAQRR